jgi:RNA polymerase sigma-70 factor (ECF subfamily)
MAVSPDMEIALPVTPVLAPAAVSPEQDWETTLVRSCQQGDPDAFRLLVERYQGKVFSIAYALVRRRPDVEDIAQQVFTKVYFGIKQFDFRSAFLTWIYKITVNECYDFLRKQRSNRMVCVSEMSEEEARQFTNRSAGEILPDRQAELVQTTALLLKKVPEEERLLLLLREVEGYSIHDLSRMFDWNENTVKVKLFRARQRLVKVAKRHSLTRRERREHAAAR